jgi:rare lipoprotein A
MGRGQGGDRRGKRSEAPGVIEARVIRSAGRESLDAALVWADPRAHRATRVAPDVIEKTGHGGSGADRPPVLGETGLMGARRPDSLAGPLAPRRPAPRQTAEQIGKVLGRWPTDPANGKVKLVLTFLLEREAAEQLSARASAAGKNVEHVVVEAIAGAARWKEGGMPRLRSHPIARGSAIYARGRIGRALVATVSCLVPGLSRVGTPLPWVITVAMAMTLAGCATPGGVKAPVPEMAAPPAQPPQTPPPQVGTGAASWYGKAHNGRPTASGEIYDMNDLTAAHRSLPLGTRVLVTNLKNGRSVEVRVNDRGPVDRGRIIDLSYAAAVEIDAVEDGTVPVRLRVLSPPPSQQKPAR